MVNTIDEALDYIYSHIDYSMTHAKDISADVFSLNAIQALTEKLGNPQDRFPIIHVAGTKGKGSVCSMLASALQAAGFKTGLYTSPHLIRFNERIMVDGKMITDQEIIDLTNRFIEPVNAVGHVSSFEMMTAMAFAYFRDQKVDIAVVETGLGGRLDATNIVTPILSIITSISYDHTGFLGNTIEAIAGEKAGIIKPGVPVICGCQPYPEAVKIIKQNAQKKNSPWINVPNRYRFINKREKSNESMLIWRVEDQELMENWCGNKISSTWQPVTIPLPLRGLHQIQNAAAVYAAICKVKSVFPYLDIEKALEGIGNTFWPCRFEVLDENKPLVADGAHNIDSIRKLCQTIDRYYGTKEITCIFGASEDKELAAMISELAPHVDRFIMTRSTHPRAAEPKVLSEISSKIGRENRTADSLEDAYAAYLADSNENSCFIVTGSLFVAGGIRELYMKDHSIKYFD